MLNFENVIKTYGVNTINSYTKYPSIQTYHEINSGTLNANLTDNVGFADETVYITEKVDGTNGRILILNGDFIIGSREELLYRKGDMFGNPSQGIVDIMLPFATELVNKIPSDNILYVFYGEVYGSNINGAKQYTKHKKSNVRFFDCTMISIEDNKFVEIVTSPIETISSWREHGGQNYVTVEMLLTMMKNFGYDKKNTVPYIKICKGTDIPINRKETYDWLKTFEKSNATIDEDFFEMGNKSKAEGVVVRNESRSFIRKIRFEDYEKTIRKFGNL